MDKIAENSRSYDLIHNTLVAWIFIYLMSVLGVFCKYYFNLKDSIWVGIITIILSMVLYKVLSSKILNDVESDFKIYIVLVWSPFMMGFCMFHDMTLIGFTTSILTPFIYIIMGLRFLSYDRDRMDIFIYVLCYLVLSCLIICFKVFTGIFNVIVGDINDFFILSLTIILLGATFSLLAFTYYMVLDNNEVIKKEMKSIGEHFFISTLFSMFFLIIVFIFAMYCEVSGILSLGNINFIEPLSFIMVNIFVILFFLLGYTLAISLRYLGRGIWDSLKNLPFKF